MGGSGCGCSIKRVVEQGQCVHRMKVLLECIQHRRHFGAGPTACPIKHKMHVSTCMGIPEAMPRNILTFPGSCSRPMHTCTSHRECFHLMDEDGSGEPHLGGR